MTLVVSETQQVLQRLNLDILSFFAAWLIRNRFKQENFISRCCINFTLQLMQLKHISDPSLFKATNNAEEIRLNNSDCFLYMQHISDHHLSIYLISSNHSLKHNLHLSTRAKLLLNSILKMRTAPTLTKKVKITIELLH